MSPENTFVFFLHESHRLPEVGVLKGLLKEEMLLVQFQEAISTFMKITQVPILNPRLSRFI